MDFDTIMDSLDEQIAKEFHTEGRPVTPRKQPNKQKSPQNQKKVVPVEEVIPQMVELFVSPAIRIGDREYIGHEIVNEFIAAELRRMMWMSNQHKQSVTVGGAMPIVALNSDKNPIQ